MEKNYKDCDPDLAKRIEATSKISKENIIAKMKKDFLEQEEEREVNNIVCQDRQLIKIRFNPTEETNFNPISTGRCA